MKFLIEFCKKKFGLDIPLARSLVRARFLYPRFRSNAKTQRSEILQNDWILWNADLYCFWAKSVSPPGGQPPPKFRKNETLKNHRGQTEIASFLKFHT